MDAFFASIEQAINPRLKGKPLIVGSRNNKMYTVVCAASYEAKAYGISSGMASKDAYQLCPNLEFVPAEQSKYIWTSEQIFEMVKTYGFEVSYASIDEFRMDIDKEPQPFILAKTIQKQIEDRFHITASIGIAKNCILAKLASKLKKPNGIAILTEKNLTQALAQTPVQKLCGVGKKSQTSFNSLGIQTCLDLYEKTPDFLQRFSGKNGLNLYAALHATEHFSQEIKEEAPQSIGHSYTLPRASKTPRFIKSWLRLLSEMVAERLRQKNLTSQTTHLWLNGPEIGNLMAQRTQEQATNDGYEIYARTLRIMVKIAPRPALVRALGITCSSLHTPDYPPLFTEQKRREALIKAMDKINTKLGEGSIIPAVITLSRKIA
ncbi:MAG: DNA polymerase IV [Candidatus Omnitrophota bacterium]